MEKISLKSARTLADRQWLDDEVMDFFIKDIVQDSDHINDIHIMRSTFYLQLLSGPTRNSRFRKILNTVVSNFKDEKIFDKRIMIIPICDCFHWIMLIIEIPEITINEKDRQQIMYCYHYNSLGYKIDSGLINNIKDYLRFRLVYETGIDCNVNLINIQLNLPRQLDSFNCGIYILHYLEKTLDNIDSRLDSILDNKLDFAETWNFDPNLKRVQLINQIYILNKCKELKIVATQAEMKAILGNTNDNDEKSKGSDGEVE